MGLDALRKYGGVNNVAGGYVSQYETGAFADLTRQQAQDLVSHALADAANSRTPIDPLRDVMYNSTNLDIEIHMNANGKTVSLSLSVPDFAVETKAFLDALEFEEPVDGGSDVPKCYDDCDEPAVRGGLAYRRPAACMMASMGSMGWLPQVISTPAQPALSSMSRASSVSSFW